jgi:hypothetical protein
MAETPKNTTAPVGSTTTSFFTFALLAASMVWHLTNGVLSFFTLAAIQSPNALVSRFMGYVPPKIF